MEIWKQIAGFDGAYHVSNLGRIRRSPLKPKKNNGVPGAILKQDLRGGYLAVCLSNGTAIHKSVHRLVAFSFLGNPPGKVVNHKDGNKQNNNLENLEWVTPSENFRHAEKSGLWKPVQGSSHGRSKLKENDVLEIRRLSKNGASNSDISRIFSQSRPNISLIVRRKTWRHVA